MKFRIQTDDGRTVEWQQDGPLAFKPRQPGVLADRLARRTEDLVPDAEVIFTDAEATELCLELSYQIVRLRHPEREWPE